MCHLSDNVIGLFGKKVFSEAGTSELKKEQSTYMMFKDLLEELESKLATIVILK